MDAHIKPAENWDEIKTAYHVARLGTLSAAARYLNMHHATVIRHIDALESRLGCKLFQRHARGYQPTEAGHDLLKVAEQAEEQFEQLRGRLQGQAAMVSGDLTITALEGMSHWLVPVLVKFQDVYPDIHLSLNFDLKLLRLEHGKAHVALRAGTKPVDPDNVVRHLAAFPVALYTSRWYVARHGLPKGTTFKGHRFVMPVKGDNPAPQHSWLAQIHANADVVLRVPNELVHDNAIRAGAGIGFMAMGFAEQFSDLVRLDYRDPDWEYPIWIVTHRDLSRTAKVKALVQHMQANADKEISSILHDSN